LPAEATKFMWGVNAALSPDGRMAYASLSTTRVGVFDVGSGRYLRDFSVHFADPDGQRIVAVPWQFAPDGTLLFGAFDAGPRPKSDPFALGGDTLPPNHRLGRVDPTSGRLLAQVGLGDILSVSAVAWSHDGSQLAVGTQDGTVSLLDARTLAVKTAGGAVEPGYVHTLYFSPDDRTLVVGGTSAGLSILSVPDLGREGARVSFGAGANGGGVFAWFDPSGALVGFAPDVQKPAEFQQRWFRFPNAPSALVSAACSLADTDVTPAQWQRYVGNRPYEHICATH
jgi:hypothetical protein